ncbi:MAG: MFS transporter [Chloroflexi bacterium]|nr:MFS transporter [Chloroflexota bacterium]
MFRRRDDARRIGETIEAAAVSRRSRSATHPRSYRRYARAPRIPRPLQHPAFFRLWTVSLLSYMGRFTDYTVIAWLIGQHWDSPLAIGLLIFFRFSPFFLIGPLFGLIADRFPRILIVRIAQAGVGSISFLFGLLLIAAIAPLWALYAYVFMNGMLFLLEMPARRTYLTGIVGRRYITSALALDMISLNMAWFIGSNMAGVLLDTVNPGYVYIGLGSIGFLNVILLRGLPILFHPTTDERVESFLSSFRRGLGFVRGNRVIVGLLIAVGLTNLTGFTFESMIAVIAREQFDAGPLLFGLLISAQGMGALIVAVVLATTRWRVHRHGLMVLTAAFMMHLFSAGLTWLAWAPAGFAVLMILGMTTMGFSIMHNSMLLMLTPDRMRGRIIGIQVVVLGMFPLGALGLGALAGVLGSAEAIRVVAFGGIAILLLIVVVFPELRRPTETIE